MNKTNLYHALWAVLISSIAIAIGYVFDAQSHLLCFAGSLWFLSREFNHAEYEAKKRMGKKEIDTSVSLEALKMWNWSSDTLLDFLCPLFANIILWTVFTM